jgi:tetratricopeptide (TPR) repeat protein
MNTSTAYSLAAPYGRDDPSLQQPEEPAEAFAAALRRTDWNEAERLLLAAEDESGDDTEAWTLRRSDWYLAQQRWDEAATHLKRLLAEDSRSVLFQSIVRHKLASIAFMRGDDAACVAWLSPLLEAEGVAIALPQGFRAVEILWVRALHRSGATDRLHRWAAQLDARGELDAGVAGVASLACWERRDLALARRWIAMGQRREATPSPECWMAAARVAMSKHASLAEAASLAEDACARWPGDGRCWAVRGSVKLLAGDAEGGHADLERAVDLAPSYTPAWRGLGWAQILLGKAEAAEKSFRVAVDLDDEHSESHGGLGVSLMLQQREDEAGDCLRKCQSLDRESLLGGYLQFFLLEGSKQPLDLLGVLKF